MKKILVVINRLGVGGAERLVVDDINEMLRRGIDVRLLTLQPEKKENSLASECAIAADNWRKIYFRSFLDIQHWFEFVRFMREYKPDAVISHLWYANTISRIVSKFGGIKTHLAFEHNVDSVKTRKMFMVDRFLQSFSTRIIAVSGVVKQSLVRHGINPQRVFVLHNAVDTSQYFNISDEIVRKELNPENKFVYLFIGRLIEQKGVDVLLEAFAKLKTGLLFLVGDGTDRQKLITLAGALGISLRVRFLGIRHDIPELFAVADCFVLPSRYEGLGTVLIEAMVSGKAIIVSDFEAGKELIQHGKNGLVVPKEDSEALTAAMLYMQRDNDLREKFEVAAKETAAAFSIEHHVDALLRATDKT